MATLFAGIPVTDFTRSLDWFRRFLGAEPAFFPTDIEAVWTVSGDAYLYIEQVPERAGGSMVMLMIDDLDATLAGISARGIEPDRQEDYEQNTRKVIFRDPDGNEISYGATAAE